MNDLISVIIPIYKVEKYLNKCIDSVVNQTYTNLEIILVDDGSPDTCPNICDKWAEKDNRIKVIHKENGGVSSARNAALNLASGQYIGFVDPDDYIEPEMYQVLIESAKEKDADVVFSGYNRVIEDRLIENNVPKVIYKNTEAITDLLYLNGNIKSVLWNKLYARETIGNIRFKKGLENGEDTYFNYYVFKNIKKCVSVPKCLYNWVYRASSGTAQEYKLNFHIQAVRDSALDIEKDCKKNLSVCYGSARTHTAIQCYIVLKKLLTEGKTGREYIREQETILEIMKRYKAGSVGKTYGIHTMIAWVLCKIFPEVYGDIILRIKKG